MALYEHVFIARQDISAAQVDSLISELSQIVESQGGSVKGHEYWGLKTMAYRIKKNRKGHYVMLNIDANPAAVRELERNQRIHEDVLRQLTLRVEAFEDGPSIMMQGKRDGERRGRGDRRDDRDRDDRDNKDRQGRARDEGQRDARADRDGNKAADGDKDVHTASSGESKDRSAKAEAEGVDGDASETSEKEQS